MVNKMNMHDKGCFNKIGVIVMYPANVTAIVIEAKEGLWDTERGGLL